MNARRRGFTLIELLVVVAIIALLISVLVPSLSAARRQSRQVVCASQLRGIAQGMVNYATESRDEVPLNRGTEPSYMYVRSGTSGNQQWLLAELILPYMGYPAPSRTGPNNSFTDEDFERAASSGRIFYCPSTGNFAINDARQFANWMDHSDWGAFMDYAQMWGWVGPFANLAQLRPGSLITTSTEGAYAVLDDEQNPIKPSDWPAGAPAYNPMSGMQYRLPHSLASEPLRLPGGGARSRVPMMMDYIVSRDTAPAGLRQAVVNGTLRPQAANHIWSGRGERNGRVLGANYAYSDGSVFWRRTSEVMPRLTLWRTFGGESPYPTYWW